MKFAFIVYINPLDSYAHGFITIKPVTKVETMLNLHCRVAIIITELYVILIVLGDRIAAT